MRRTASWAVGAGRCIAPRRSGMKQEARRLECDVQSETVVLIAFAEATHLLAVSVYSSVWRVLAARGAPAEPGRRITELNAPNHWSSRRSQEKDLGVSQLLPRFWRDQQKAELCISAISTSPFSTGTVC